MGFSMMTTRRGAAIRRASSPGKIKIEGESAREWESYVREGQLRSGGERNNTNFHFPERSQNRMISIQSNALLEWRYLMKPLLFCSPVRVKEKNFIWLKYSWPFISITPALCWYPSSASDFFPKTTMSDRNNLKLIFNLFGSRWEDLQPMYPSVYIKHSMYHDVLNISNWGL